MKPLFPCIFLALLMSACKKDGVNGKNSLIDFVTEEPGENCAAGGYLIKSGLDINSNNILDASEVQKNEYVCNGAPGGTDTIVVSDKETRLLFNFSYWTTNSINWELAPPYTYLINFEKTNFYADSIVFVASLGVQFGSKSNKCYVQLYNVTDNTVIANSQLEDSSLELVWKFSSNLIDELPSKKIDLGIQVKSEDGSGYVQVNTPMLILYKN